MTGAGPLVLVVEDEPPVRRFLRAALGAHGYRVVEAGTVREAEQLAPGHNPDVFLLDLGLPDGDGVDLARRSASGPAPRSSSSPRAAGRRTR